MQQSSSAARAHVGTRRKPEPKRIRVFHADGPAQPRPALWRSAVWALRPHQWAKNLLLFLPLLLAHQVNHLAKWMALALAFVLLNACASAVYLLNDVVDLDADRRHPTKRNRPIASGLLSVPLALAISMSLLVAALAASCFLMPWAFTGMLAIYLLATTGYSLYFKRVLFLDVLVLAGLYTHRILTGGVVAGVEVSHWLMGFSMFFFLSLAMVKRYVELRSSPEGKTAGGNRRDYLADDTEMIQSIGLTSGYLSVLVLCMYISSNAVETLYPHPSLLWLIAPVLLYWITRLWLLARRGLVSEDPVAAALKDVNTYLVGLVCAGLLLAGSL